MTSPCPAFKASKGDMRKGKKSGLAFQEGVAMGR
jgi:hypothetical protein